MSAPVRFAHLSDTHIKPEAIDRSQIFVDHLAEIQAGGYDFVIHTGDLMDEPSAWSARAFKAIASQMQVPIYCVPGNHDVYNPPMGEIEAPWWARLEVSSSLEAQYHSWFGPTWHTFSHQGVHLVGIDSLIINSGLPEEETQWAWLEETMADLASCQPEHVILFAHQPLFIERPDECLDAGDFANPYLVIAPPGRDRLLELIHRHRVTAVLTGHIHASWQKSHTWPEGFTTQFICTGSSGKISTMAIDQFNLPQKPADGLGYHEHRVTRDGITSWYHPHTRSNEDGKWNPGPAWRSQQSNGRTPSPQQGREWHHADYVAGSPEWLAMPAAPRLALGGSNGETTYVQLTFETEKDAAALYLELLTERAVTLYLNGALVCNLEALGDRPPAWRSAGGTYTIDGPNLHLPLNQRLIQRGQNVLALSVYGEIADGRYVEENITLRKLEYG